MSEENKVIDEVNTSCGGDSASEDRGDTTGEYGTNTSCTATGRTGAEAGRLLQRDCGGSCS